MNPNENSPSSTATSPRIAAFLDAVDVPKASQSMPAGDEFVKWLKALHEIDVVTERTTLTAGWYSGPPTNPLEPLRQRVRDALLVQFGMKGQESPTLLTSRVAFVEQQLKQLRADMTAPAGVQPFIVPITTLVPEPFELIRDIPAVVEPTGDDFLATFYDANVSASGETPTEAVANLKDLLISKYDLLDSLSDAQLAPHMKRQRDVLRTIMRRAA